jgi:hypothetical protein
MGVGGLVALRNVEVGNSIREFVVREVKIFSFRFWGRDV